MSPEDQALFYVNKVYVLNGKKDWEQSKRTAFFLVDELQKESTMVRVSPTPRFDYWEDVKKRIILL